MAFNFNQIIIPGIPIVDSQNLVTNRVEIRIMKDSRRQFLVTDRGLFDNSFNYYANDQVCSGTTFWRALVNVSSGGGTPTEGANWTKSDKFDWAWGDDTTIFILETIGGYDANIVGHGPGGLFVNGFGPLSRYDSKDEGKMSPDRRELLLRDGITVTGTDATGMPVTYDFSTDQYKSFLAWLFYNKDALTTWSFNRALTSTPAINDPGDYECYWMGDSKNGANTGPDLHNLGGRSVNARQVSQRQVVIEGGINRLESLVTSDVFPLIAQPVYQTTGSVYYPGTDFTDWLGNGDAVQFVGGVVANQGCQTVDWSLGNWLPGSAPIDAFGLDVDWSGFGILGDKSASGGVFAVVPSNLGLHYMTLDTMFTKIATRAQMLWNSANCPIPVKVWSDISNEGSNPNPNIIQAIRIDLVGSGNLLTNTGICYEGVFGSDPRCDLNVSEISTPVSLGWDTPLSDSLVNYAKLFFAKLSFPIDQTTKQQKLVFTSLQYLNTVAGSTLAAGITSATATTCTIASGSTFLTAATTAIGQDATAFLSGGGTIFAQLQNNGDAQTIGVTGVNTGTNVVTFTIKDTPLLWPATTTELNPVQLLPLKWKDGAKVQTDPAMISAKRVELTTKGDDDVVTCPKRQGDALSITAAHNVRKFGSLGSGLLELSDLVPNTGQTLAQQRNGWTPLTILPNGGGFYANSGYGHLCYMPGCTVVSADQFSPDQFNIKIYNPRIDARYFFTSAAHGPAQTEICQWRIPSTGAMGWSWITNVFDRNTFEIGITEFQTQGFPTTEGFPINSGDTLDILVGYTVGPTTAQGGSFGDIITGWLFDITIGSTYGAGADFGNTIITKQNFLNNDVYFASWVGQTIVLPKYGIFKMIDLSWDGTHTTITLDATIPYGAINVEGRIGPPQIANDGWAFAQYLYYMNGLTSNDQRFGSSSYGSPPIIQDAFPEHEWSGFRNQYSSQPNQYLGAYTLSRLVVGLPYGSTDVGNIPAPPDAYGAAHYSLAQAFAAKFIGVFAQSTRGNIGVLDSNGSLIGWGNGDSLIEQREGAVRCFSMNGHDLSELHAGSMDIRIEEWPNFSEQLNPAQYPVLIKGGGTSGGAGGGGGVGGGGGSASGATITTLNPPAFTASQNNLTVSTSFTTPFTVINLTNSSGSPINITGLANGAANIVVKLRNVGTEPIILTNEDTGNSTAANCFHIDGGNTPIGNAGINFFWDALISRWVPF